MAGPASALWSPENDPLARIARDHAVDPAGERLIGGFDCAVDDTGRRHQAGGGAGRIG